MALPATARHSEYRRHQLVAGLSLLGRGRQSLALIYNRRGFRRNSLVLSSFGRRFAALAVSDGTMHLILFIVFAGLCLAGAVNLLLQSHPINSALSLVVVMTSLAVLYLLLGA